MTLDAFSYPAPDIEPWAAMIVSETLETSYASVHGVYPEVLHLKFAHQEFWRNLLGGNIDKALTWQKLIKLTVARCKLQQCDIDEVDRCMLAHLMHEISIRLSQSPHQARERCRVLFIAAEFLGQPPAAAMA